MCNLKGWPDVDHLNWPFVLEENKGLVAVRIISIEQG
jgi:hypothetical protein